MKSCILCFALILNQHCFSNSADSLHKEKKKRNNLIEVGTIHGNLFNGDRFYPVMRKERIWSYTRYHKKWLGRIEYYTFYSGIRKSAEIKSIRDFNEGDVIYTNFNSIRLGIGRKIAIGSFLIAPSFLITYRYNGGQDVFIEMKDASIWDEPIIDVVHLRSFGAGLGSGISYVIKKRISLGADANLCYNFEKERPSQLGYLKPEGSIHYTPHRAYSTCHLRLGVLF